MRNIVNAVKAAQKRIRNKPERFSCFKKLFFQVDNGSSQSQNDLNGSLVISNHRVWPQKGPILSLNRVKTKPLLFRRLWTEAQLELFGVLSLTVAGPRLC